MTDFLTSFENEIKAEDTFELPAMCGLTHSWHSFEQDVVDAINTARNINRPLLIKGDPGLGKSQIAHAVAVRMQWNLLTYVVHARTQPTDLLYRIDHVKRLAKAQLLGAFHAASDNSVKDDDNHKKSKSLLAKIDEKHFIVPGCLWWAYDADSARSFYDNPENHYRSGINDQIDLDKPSVLLIDEIDKADSELPNTLLEVLNNRSFHVPASDQVISVDEHKAPFVVITSNSERALPQAFLRRCVVITLSLPEGDDCITRLEEIAATHQIGDSEKITADVINEAATMLMKRRKQVSAQQYKPGTSEFLDLLHALDSSSYKNEASCLAGLKCIGEFILNK